MIAERLTLRARTDTLLPTPRASPDPSRKRRTCEDQISLGSVSPSACPRQSKTVTSFYVASSAFAQASIIIPTLHVTSRPADESSWSPWRMRFVGACPSGQCLMRRRYGSCRVPGRPPGSAGVASRPSTTAPSQPPPRDCAGVQVAGPSTVQVCNTAMPPHPYGDHIDQAAPWAVPGSVRRGRLLGTRHWGGTVSPADHRVRHAPLRGRHRVGGAVVGLGVLLVLSGCSGDGAAAPDGTRARSLRPASPSLSLTSEPNADPQTAAEGAGAQDVRGNVGRADEGLPQGEPRRHAVEEVRGAERAEPVRGRPAHMRKHGTVIRGTLGHEPTVTAMNMSAKPPSGHGVRLRRSVEVDDDQGQDRQRSYRFRRGSRCATAQPLRRSGGTAVG